MHLVNASAPAYFSEYSYVAQTASASLHLAVLTGQYDLARGPGFSGLIDHLERNLDQAAASSAEKPDLRLLGICLYLFVPPARPR